MKAETVESMDAEVTVVEITNILQNKFKKQFEKYILEEMREGHCRWQCPFYRIGNFYYFVCFYKELCVVYKKLKIELEASVLSFNIVIHIHQITDTLGVIGNVGIAVNSMLNHTAGYRKVNHIHRLIIMHIGVN